MNELARLQPEIQLSQLATFLDRYFRVDRYEADVNGIYRSSHRPIQRLAVALEPHPGLPQWVKDHQADALLLHRPWGLELGQLPHDVGVLAYHLPFDEQLTLGYNLRLATALGLSVGSQLGEKAGRAIGMVGSVETQSFEQYSQQVEAIFGGYDQACKSKAEISRVAVVGAMTEALVREASDRGVDVYITGQFRKAAATAVQETGIGLIAVGHERSEVWGMQALMHLLAERWSAIEILSYP